MRDLAIHAALAASFNPSIYSTTASGFLLSSADIVPLLMNGSLTPPERVPKPAKGYPKNHTGWPIFAAFSFSFGIVTANGCDTFSSVSSTAMSASSEGGKRSSVSGG